MLAFIMHLRGTPAKPVASKAAVKSLFRRWWMGWTMVTEKPRETK